jgi:hypothetical protein
LIFSGIMAFEKALLFVNAGMGLMGIALLLTLPAGRRLLGMRTAYFLFTLAVALGMATALLGVFLNDAYLPLLQGEIGLGELPPILVALLIFAPLQMLGYPIWLLLTGRRLMELPGIQEVQPFKKSRAL